MKECPTCRMIVDEPYECPYCQTTLTYENPVMTDREKLRCNRYFWLFQLKNCWFSLLCLLVSAVVTVLSCTDDTPLLLQPMIQRLHLTLTGGCLLLLLYGFFQRQIARWNPFGIEKHTTEEGRIFGIKLFQYAISGFLAAASVVMYLLRQ